MAKLTSALTVYLPDTRGVEISRFGKGNLKIGADVYTYSRLAGRDGTCPGSTTECEAICYAKRIGGPWMDFGLYRQNGVVGVPPLPADATLVRAHVSGDFDSVSYIEQWIARLTERPDVTFWAYTRSWRVPALLPALERLRALPNVQLLASMDESTPEVPPAGWRRAWIDGDTRAGEPVRMHAYGTEVISQHNFVTFDGARSYVCPEETKRKANCAACRYCFDGARGDVTFLRH